MLSVTGLHGGYGAIPVLNGVDLEVGTGAAAAVLGANGMGKTTLMRVLMGFLAATRGRVVLDGRDLTHAAPHERARAGLGYVPQGRGTFLRMTVRDQLRFAAAARGRGPADLSDVLERLPVVAPLLDRTGDALSGGERQLVALATCLSTRPRLLLLDEPTEGIQPAVVDAILELLAELKERDRLTILLAEQNLGFAAELCDRAFVMRRGTIAATLAASDIRESPSELDEMLVGAP